MTLEYPGWALAMIVMLIVFASLPVPILYIHSMWKNRRLHDDHSEEAASQEVHRELYTKCSSTEQLDSNSHHQVPSEEDGNHPRITFLPIGSEHYRLLPQQEEEDEEEDTGLWARRLEDSCSAKWRGCRCEQNYSFSKEESLCITSFIIFSNLYIFEFFFFFSYLYHWRCITSQSKSFLHSVMMKLHLLLVPPSYLFSEPLVLFRR